MSLKADPVPSGFFGFGLSFVAAPVGLARALAFMKRAFSSISITILLFVAFFYGLIWLLPSDIVTSEYATLEAARADHLFGRGWLPDILPLSAYDIRTSNNLDFNTSEGEFLFDPSEYKAFVSHVRPYGNDYSLFGKWEQTVYIEDGSTWMFSCKISKGYCEYTMWSH